MATFLQSEVKGHYLTYIEDDERHVYTLDGEIVPGGSTFTKGGYPTSEGIISWSMGRAAEYAFQEGYRLGSEKAELTQKQIKEVIKAAKKRPEMAAQAAADVGTVVHDYAYWFEKGDKERANGILLEASQREDFPKIKNGISLFHDWEEKNRDEIVASEEIVALPCNNHEEGDEAKLCYCFAGKFDRLAMRKGVGLVLSDFKTSSGIYVGQFLQEGAYTPAIEYWMEEKLNGETIAGLEILRFGKTDGKFEPMLIKDPDEIKAIVRQALVCRMTYAFDKKWSRDKRFKFIGSSKNTKRRKESNESASSQTTECDSVPGQTTTG